MSRSGTEGTRVRQHTLGRVINVLKLFGDERRPAIVYSNCDGGACNENLAHTEPHAGRQVTTRGGSISLHLVAMGSGDEISSQMQGAQGSGNLRINSHAIIAQGKAVCTHVDISHPRYRNCKCVALRGGVVCAV